MEEKKHLLLSIRLHNLNPYEKTLMEEPDSVSEKPLFLSIFIDESVRNGQDSEPYTYNWSKYEFFSLSLPGHFALKFHRC